MTNEGDGLLSISCCAVHFIRCFLHNQEKVGQDRDQTGFHSHQESIYKDHISFINHNRPLPPVTIEDLNTKMEFKDRNYLNDELKEMFFKLDLIQSYGSGIRRAKTELNKNAMIIWNWRRY